MKTNRTKLFLLGIPLVCLLLMMAKKDLAPMTFKPFSTQKQFKDFSTNTDSTVAFTMDKIPYLDLMRMMAKYRDERQEIINAHFSGTGSGQYGENFVDSRYYYISLETMERYIAYIKQQVRDNDLNVQFSGIRIYPIVYPNTGSSSYFSSIPSIYRNHQSIVFTPTYMDESGYAIDFDPDVYMANPNGNGNVPKSLLKPDTQSVASFISATFGGDLHGQHSAQDHIWICPPPICAHAAALTNSDNICPDNGACPY